MFDQKNCASRRVLVASVLLLAACGADSSADAELSVSEKVSSLDEPSPKNEPHKQTPEEALDHDLHLIAEARGWTYEEAKADHVAAEAVAKVAEDIAKSNRQISIGSALSEIPGGPPTVYVKGAVPDVIASIVKASSIPIKIADSQPFSFDELEERQHKVQQALVKAGIEALTEFRLENQGVIDAVVARRDELGEAAVLAALPSELRDSIKVSFADASGFVKQDISAEWPL
jgi:streptogrisin C